MHLQKQSKPTWKKKEKGVLWWRWRWWGLWRWSFAEESFDIGSVKVIEDYDVNYERNYAYKTYKAYNAPDDAEYCEDYR